MSEEIRIIFLGDEPDIVSDGQNFFKKKSGPNRNFIFDAFTPHPEFSFADIILKNDCLLIIIDFTHSGISQDSILTQMGLIKKHEVYRRIVFAGLFKDKDSLREKKYLEHLGLTYAFIKGNDLSLLFEDNFYIAFDQNPGFPSFARAKDLNLPYVAGSPALITAINDEYLKINNDIEFSEPLHVESTFLGGKRLDKFTIEANTPIPGTGDAFFNYTLPFPYPGPWDDIENETLLKDTVETFLGNDGFSDEKNQIIVSTTNDDLFFNLLKLGTGKYFHLTFTQNILKCALDSLLPQLIIIDSTPGDLDVEKFIALMLQNILSEESYEPMIIVFRTNKSSEEVRKNLDYQKVLCHPHPCDFKTLELLINKYGQKPLSHATTWKRFNPSHPDALAEVKIDVVITGLSEHAITFLSSYEIPMYSNLKFDVPVECEVLIVPPLRELHKSPKGDHYMGIIHGIDQDESKYLRKFVNQIIFSPLKKFERIPLKLDQEEKKDIVPERPEVKEVPSPERASFKINRRTYKKSKL